jgi:hypothetical protein
LLCFFGIVILFQKNYGGLFMNEIPAKDFFERNPEVTENLLKGLFGGMGAINEFLNNVDYYPSEEFKQKMLMFVFIAEFIATIKTLQMIGFDFDAFLRQRP